MIHTIIYANRERGYDLYDRSPDFPERALPAVRSVCERMCSPRPCREERPRIRFAPAAEDSYLLTACISQPDGNRGESRGHHTGVSFLMDREDADALLDAPARTMRAASVLTGGLLSGDEEPVALSAEEFLDYSPDPASFVSPPEPAMQKALLMAAWYAASPARQGQVMAVSRDGKEEAEACIAWLLSVLPPDVRRRLSFHTGILSAAEGSGTFLKFASPSRFSAMKARDFEGGDKTALALYAEGGLTSYDPLADKAADRLVSFIGKEDLKAVCCRAKDQTKAFLAVADGKITGPLASGGNSSMESRKNRKEHKKRSVLPALSLQLITAALTCLLILAMARRLITLTLDKGGQYLVLSLVDVRTLILCGACLAIGMVLGSLLTLVIRTLSGRGD